MKSISKSSQEVKQYSANCTIQPTYERCPGCYGWTQSNHLVTVPAGLLDDNQSFDVCLSCAIKLRYTGGYEAIAAIVNRIGSYCGWKD